MKRLLVGIITGCVILVACTAPVEQTDAKSEDIWEVIGTQKIGKEEITEVRHIKTGCHSTFIDDWEGAEYEPMFVEDASSGTAPYCTYDK